MCAGSGELHSSEPAVGVPMTTTPVGGMAVADRQHVAPPSRPCLQTTDSIAPYPSSSPSSSSSPSGSTSVPSLSSGSQGKAQTTTDSNTKSKTNSELPAAPSGHGSQISKVWARPTFNEIRREVHFPRHPFARKGRESGEAVVGSANGEGSGSGSGFSSSSGSGSGPKSGSGSGSATSATTSNPDDLPAATPEEIVNWIVSNCRILWGPIQDLLGYSPSEIEPTIEWWSAHIHPEDLPRLQKEIGEYCAPHENRGAAESRLWNGVYRFKKKDGGWVTIGDRMNTVRDEEGYPTYAESYMYDHNMRMDERSRLKSIGNENDFQIVCGNMYSAIFMMNSSGYVTFMNAAAERLTGFKYDEISKVTFHEAVHSLRPDGSAYPISQCPIYLAQVENTKLTNAPEVFVDRDGRFFPVVYSVAPLHGGYQHGAVIEFRDVSEEVRLEEDRMKALRQNEQKSAKIKQEEFLRQNMAVFTDFLCHEVRNPLHGIAANKNFLLESIQQLEDVLKPFIQQEENGASTSSGDSSKPSIKEGSNSLFASMRGYLQAIDECAAHQGMILNSVLDLSRLEMGALKLCKEPFSPYEIAMQAVKMSRAQAEGRNVKIKLEADEETKAMIVKGDPTPVRQVFLNLIGNGVKFSHSGGTVTAKMKLQQHDHSDKYRMDGSIQDEGVGMTPVEVGRLFQRFAQANQRVSEVYGGSGLGLSISKELLKLMEGELNVESEKGQGSQFMFTAKFGKLSKAELEEFRDKNSRPATPTIDGAGTVTQTRKRGVKPARRRFTHILAAEDNALNRQILAKYLQKCDHLTLVNDGQQAVDYYKEHSHEIDIIIMDQEMPLLDGRQATKLIREHEKELEAAETKTADEQELQDGPGQRRKRKEWLHRVPIIALSGNVRSEQIAVAKEAGMDDYLNKPCSKTALETMLAKWEEVILGPDEEHHKERESEQQQDKHSLTAKTKQDTS